MVEDYSEDTDTEVLCSMWPESLGKEADKQFNVEQAGTDQDMLEEVSISQEPFIVDFKRLMELANYSEKGSSQLAYLLKQWKTRQANAFRLLNEQLDILNKQRQEAELKELEILEEHMFEEDKYVGDKRPVSILHNDYVFEDEAPSFKKDVFIDSDKCLMDDEHDSSYWKGRAKRLEKLLDASIQRENKLQEKLQENIGMLENRASPVEELSQILKRADNFLHFILQNAPIVIGHQDKDMRYRFIYNHFPSLQEEDIIGRTDVEILSGAGIKESQDFKQEVLQRGLPAKREIHFETELFGSKTFLIYVEPVFSKTGEKIGVNFMGMDITDQVAKREKLAKLREEIAVQNAMETELNKTIHITEETMRAKQMLATMSHEIRSPLTGVVGMAEILATTKLDPEQQQLLDVMRSSGDLVLQIINDILDLSKVESGAMKLESTKFRPREVVRHVLQTAAASLQKELTLEGLVEDEVPLEVIGDVLRIRQILTNLVSNAIKFTHEGKVGIRLRVTSPPSLVQDQKSDVNNPGDLYSLRTEMQNAQNIPPLAQGDSHAEGTFHGAASRNTISSEHNETIHQFSKSETRPLSPIDEEENPDIDSDDKERLVWLHCDVYDTGIGIPEKALPALFKKYMQVSTAHARKYGGTGLGLAICKQLVELMGGHLTVTSQEHCGSTFSFILPCRVPTKRDSCDEEDNDLLYGMPPEHEAITNPTVEDASVGYFQFQPCTLGSLFSSSGAYSRFKPLSAILIESNHSTRTDVSLQANYIFPSDTCTSEERDTNEDASSINYAGKRCSVLDRNHFAGNEKNYTEENHVPSHVGVQSSHAEQIPLVSQCVTASIYRQQTLQEGEDIKFPNSINGCQEEGKVQRLSDNALKTREMQNQPRILLVEDDKVNEMVTQSMLKRLGHNLHVVANGAEAVQAVQRNNYDLILMDVCMPVMDGLEATRLIRTYELTGDWAAAEVARVSRVDCSTNLQTSYPEIASFPQKRTPIIAMTANALADGIAECYANGMDSFIAKPVTFQKLKEILQKYIPG